MRARKREWYTFVDATRESGFRAAYADMLDFRYGWIHELKSLRSGRDVARMARDSSRFLKCRALALRPFVKDPFSLFSTEWLAREFHMQVVLLARHPAAFVSSCVRLDWGFSFDNLLSQRALLEALLADYVEDMERSERENQDLVQRTALFWRIAHGTMLRFAQTHPDWRIVRHEDLSDRPLAGFRSLFHHLHVEFSADVKARVERLSGVDKPAEARTGATHSLRRNSKANIKTWQRRLSPEQVRTIRAITEDVSEQLYGGDTW